MEPSRRGVMRGPRLAQGMRVLSGLVPLFAVTGCCHQPAAQEPATEYVEKKPSANAKAALDRVLVTLGGDEGQDPKRIGARLREALAAGSANSPRFKPDTVNAFVSGMKCRPLGCYTTFPAATREQHAAVNELVTSPESPLRHWTGWRYLSGLYEDGQKQRLLTVVLLDGTARQAVQK
jgi:hypothetical protein